MMDGQDQDADGSHLFLNRTAMVNLSHLILSMSTGDHFQFLSGICRLHPFLQGKWTIVWDQLSSLET